MFPLSLGPLLPLLASLVPACGSRTQPGDEVFGLDASGVVATPPPPGTPAYHRVDDSECRESRAPGACHSAGGGPLCTADADCSNGVSGRCVPNGSSPGCSCTYDTCQGDSDCSAGQLCACHDSSVLAFGMGNTCVPGNCRVDSDCGGGYGYCSPSQGPNGCNTLVGYFCHTSRDTCTNDDDCTGTVQAYGVCEWWPADDRWECKAAGVCP